MALTLLLVVEKALLDESLPVVRPGLPLLPDPLCQTQINRPQLFRAIPTDACSSFDKSHKQLEELDERSDRCAEPSMEDITKRDGDVVTRGPTMLFSEHTNPTSSIPYLVPQLAHSEGMKLVHQVIFQENGVLYPAVDTAHQAGQNSQGQGSEEKLVELLRVRRWCGAPSCSYLVESFEVLRAPAGLVQSQQLLRDWRRITVQGTIFRAVSTAARPVSMDFSAPQEKISASFMKFLFYEVAQPILHCCYPTNFPPEVPFSGAPLSTSLSTISSSLSSSSHNFQRGFSRSIVEDGCSRPLPPLPSREFHHEHYQSDDQCTSISGYSHDTWVSFHSQGETVTSDSTTASVLNSTSVSTIRDETPSGGTCSLPVKAQRGGSMLEVGQGRPGHTKVFEEEIEDAESYLEERNMHFLWRRSVMERVHRAYGVFTSSNIAAGWKRWGSYCHEATNRALIAHSIDELTQYCGGSRRAAHAAVQYLDRLVAVTTNPVKTCQDIYRRLETCNTASNKRQISREKPSSGSDSMNGGDTEKVGDGRSHSAPHHHHSAYRHSHGKESKKGSRRRGGVLPPVSTENPCLNIYLIAMIGGCIMLGCKMEDKEGIPIQWLTKCLRLEFTKEEFLQLEVILFELLQLNLANNTMDQTVEMLLFMFSGDDESLFIPPHKMHGQDSLPATTQWPHFQEHCRFFADVTLRGLYPFEAEKFNAKYRISCLDINPLLLGIAVVGYVAKLYQISLPASFLALFSQQFRLDIIKTGRRNLPLIPGDKCFVLLQEFSKSSGKLLDKCHYDRQNHNNNHLGMNESNENGLMNRNNGSQSANFSSISSDSPGTSTHFDTMSSVSDTPSFIRAYMKNPALKKGSEEGCGNHRSASKAHLMDIALQYVHESWTSFKELCTTEDVRAMRVRYPELMKVHPKKSVEKKKKSKGSFF